MSGLLARLEAELRTCADPARRIDLLAERACYLARSGEIDEANDIARELRVTAGRSGHLRAMLWVMIIEALILRFGNLSVSSEDRMNRAFVLSSSFKVEDLTDLSAAWLARFQFDRYEFVGMADHLVGVLGRAHRTSETALMRAAVVAADANQFVGQEEEAQAWYELSRSIAVKLGDRTTIGAIMYNRAAMGLARLTASADAMGKDIDRDLLHLVSIELGSAIGFQIGSRVTSLEHLTQLCQARALMLAEKWDEASERFELLSAVIEAAEDRPNRPNVRADLAWCWLHAGRREEAAALVSQISMQSAQGMDIDDQVTYLARLLRLRSELGTDPPSAEELAAFRVVCNDYLEHVQTLRAELQRLPSAQDLLQSRS